MTVKVAMKLESLGFIEETKKFMLQVPRIFTDAVDKSDDEVEAFGVKKMQDVTSNVLKPPPPTDKFPVAGGASKVMRFPYPLRWTSKKQQKAWFATKGFGSGIPYKRTGTLEKTWRLDIANPTQNARIYSMENTTPSAKFVIGKGGKDGDQQQFHRDIGWKGQDSDEFKEAMREIGEFASGVVSREWFSLVDAYRKFTA